jgi:hypothetical protein
MHYHGIVVENEEERASWKNGTKNPSLLKGVTADEGCDATVGE